MFHLLPKDILFTVFLYTDVRTILRMSQTNKFFSILVKDNLIWEPLFCTEFASDYDIKKHSINDKTDKSDQGWYFYYRDMRIKWLNAKKAGAKKQIAEQENLDVKLPLISQFETLSDAIKQKNITCFKEVIQLITNKAVIAYQDAEWNTVLAQAINKGVKEIVDAILQAIGDDDPLLIQLNDGDQIPLEQASVIAANDPSDERESIFNLLLEKTKTSKTFDLSKHFFYILKHETDVFRQHRNSVNWLNHAVLILKAFHFHLDPLFEFDAFQNNIFHDADCYRHPHCLEIFSLLFKSFDEKEDSLKLIMLSKNEQWGMIPLHFVCLFGALNTIELFIPKLRQIGVLEECLKATDDAKKAPKDHVKDRFDQETLLTFLPELL